MPVAERMVERLAGERLGVCKAVCKAKRKTLSKTISRVVHHVASEPVSHFGLHAAAILRQRILPIGVGSRMRVAFVK